MPQARREDRNAKATQSGIEQRLFGIVMKRIGSISLLIVLALGGWATYRVLYPPRVGGVAFSQLAPQAQKQRRVEAQKLVEDVEQVARSARHNEKKRFTLVASEDQLNTLLQDRLKTEKFPIRDLRAGLSPDLLTLQGTANYQGFDVPATLTGTLSARAGALIFNVTSLQLSGLPAPGALKEKAERAIGDGLQRAFQGNARARLESVRIESGKLTVTGTTG